MNELNLIGRTLMSFVTTAGYNRFEEFANSCIEFRYIGICHGQPGVGKSLAAEYFAKWHEELAQENGVDDLPPERKQIIEQCRGVLITAPVTNTPKIMNLGITRRISGYGMALAKANDERDLYEIIFKAKERCQLVIIDEADRLNINSLEEVRNLYDQHKFGLIFIGMPGIEKRFARYPQLYSRIGFSHEYKQLSEDEMRFIFPKIWSNLGVEYNDEYFSDVEALNTMIRVTGGNFRLIDRLFSQIIRIMRINNLKHVSKEVVEAARKCLIVC